MNTHTQEGNGKNGNGGGGEIQLSARQVLERDINTVRERTLSVLVAADKKRWWTMAEALVKQNADTLEKCDRTSLLLSLFGAAKLGLELGPEFGHAYIIPRKGRACLDIGYQGYIELARRGGSVKSIHTAIVYEHDEFSEWIDRDGPQFIHRPHRNGDRGNPVGVYCLAQSGDGWPSFEYMSWSEIQEIKERFAPTDRNGKMVGPWVSDEQAMARKTVVRRASKAWRKSATDRALALAVEWDEQAERGAAQTITDADLDAVPTQALPTGRRKVGASNSEATTDEATSPESSEGETFGFQSNGAHSNNGTPPAGSESEKRLNFLVGRMMVVCNCEREEASDRVFMFLDEIEARATDLGDDDTHRIVCQKVEACGKK